MYIPFKKKSSTCYMCTCICSDVDPGSDVLFMLIMQASTLKVLYVKYNKKVGKDGYHMYVIQRR